MSLPRHCLEVRTESLEQRALAEQLVEHSQKQLALDPDARAGREHRRRALQRDEVSLVGLHEMTLGERQFDQQEAVRNTRCRSEVTGENRREVPT